MARYTDRGTIDWEYERLINDYQDEEALQLVRDSAREKHNHNRRARIEIPADDLTLLQYIGGTLALTVLFLLIIIIPGLI